MSSAPYERFVSSGSRRSAQLSQHSGERCKGHDRLTQLETGTDEDTRAGYPPGEFGHETGLSDPGLAAEQDDRGPVSVASKTSRRLSS